MLWLLLTWVTALLAARQVAWFTVVGTGRRVKLHEGLNTVGRNDDNDVVLEDDSLSGAHAHVEVNLDDELYTVKDLGVRARASVLAHIPTRGCQTVYGFAFALRTLGV